MSGICVFTVPMDWGGETDGESEETIELCLLSIGIFQ
jgi:hypothetical protein